MSRFAVMDWTRSFLWSATTNPRPSPVLGLHCAEAPVFGSNEPASQVLFFSFGYNLLN